MHNKEYIIEQIRRTTIENNGVPLGIDRFRDVTGIRKDDWYGKFWTKWSDAQKEAGLNPNKFSIPAFDENWIAEKIISYIRELGHFPTKPEFKIKKLNDWDFPNLTTLRNRFGRKKEMVEKILAYCKANEGFDDIIEICLPILESYSSQEVDDDYEDGSEIIGHVYLLKHDAVYKIGKSIDASRRYKEIKTQMPFKTEEVHLIETDDPSGIEAYWHNRFKEKRLEGEWFKLSPQDVKDFKKRKFM